MLQLQTYFEPPTVRSMSSSPTSPSFYHRTPTMAPMSPTLESTPTVASSRAVPHARWLFAHPAGWMAFDRETERNLENLWDQGVEYSYVEDTHFCGHVLVHLGQLYVVVGGEKYAIVRVFNAE